MLYRAPWNSFPSGLWLWVVVYMLSLNGRWRGIINGMWVKHGDAVVVVWGAGLV